MFAVTPVNAGVKWTDRGDVADSDYENGDLTKDAQYHDMDLSSIVGAGKRLVLLRVGMAEDAGGKKCRFRTKGFSHNYNLSTRYTQVANKTVDGDVWVETDANGVIEYLFDAATWTIIYIIVRGWFV